MSESEPLKRRPTKRKTVATFSRPSEEEDEETTESGSNTSAAPTFKRRESRAATMGAAPPSFVEYLQRRSMAFAPCPISDDDDQNDEFIKPSNSVAILRACFKAARKALSSQLSDIGEEATDARTKLQHAFRAVRRGVRATIKMQQLMKVWSERAAETRRERLRQQLEAARAAIKFGVTDEGADKSKTKNRKIPKMGADLAYNKLLQELEAEETQKPSIRDSILMSRKSVFIVEPASAGGDGRDIFGNAPQAPKGSMRAKRYTLHGAKDIRLPPSQSNFDIGDSGSRSSLLTDEQQLTDADRQPTVPGLSPAPAMVKKRTVERSRTVEFTTDTARQPTDSELSSASATLQKRTVDPSSKSTAATTNRSVAFSSDTTSATTPSAQQATGPVLSSATTPKPAPTHQLDVLKETLKPTPQLLTPSQRSTSLSPTTEKTSAGLKPSQTTVYSQQYATGEGFSVPAAPQKDVVVDPLIANHGSAGVEDLKKAKGRLFKAITSMTSLIKAGAGQEVLEDQLNEIKSSLDMLSFVAARMQEDRIIGCTMDEILEMAQSCKIPPLSEKEKVLTHLGHIKDHGVWDRIETSLAQHSNNTTVSRQTEAAEQEPVHSNDNFDHIREHAASDRIEALEQPSHNSAEPQVAPAAQVSNPSSVGHFSNNATDATQEIKLDVDLLRVDCGRAFIEAVEENKRKLFTAIARITALMNSGAEQESLEEESNKIKTHMGMLCSLVARMQQDGAAVPLIDELLDVMQPGKLPPVSEKAHMNIYMDHIKEHAVWDRLGAALNQISNLSGTLQQSGSVAQVVANHSSRSQSPSQSSLIARSADQENIHEGDSSKLGATPLVPINVSSENPDTFSHDPLQGFETCFQHGVACVGETDNYPKRQAETEVLRIPLPLVGSRAGSAVGSDQSCLDAEQGIGASEVQRQRHLRASLLIPDPHPRASMAERSGSNSGWSRVKAKILMDSHAGMESAELTMGETAKPHFDLPALSMARQSRLCAAPRSVAATPRESLAFTMPNLSSNRGVLSPGDRRLGSKNMSSASSRVLAREDIELQQGYECDSSVQLNQLDTQAALEVASLPVGENGFRQTSDISPRGQTRLMLPTLTAISTRETMASTTSSPSSRKLMEQSARSWVSMASSRSPASVAASPRDRTLPHLLHRKVLPSCLEKASLVVPGPPSEIFDPPCMMPCESPRCLDQLGSKWGQCDSIIHLAARIQHASREIVETSPRRFPFPAATMLW